jgi:subtilisin family serine protease
MDLYEKGDFSGGPLADAGDLGYVPGQVLVQYREEAGNRLESDVFRSAGVESSAGEISAGKGERISLLQLEPGVSVESALQKLRSSPEVAYAEPNYLRRLTYTPPDPYFPQQWGLENTGQTIEGSVGVPGADIKATQAWDVEWGFGNPVTVAFIDSGVDLDHPDLRNKWWRNVDEIPYNGIDDDRNGYIDDYNGYNWGGISQYRATNNPWGLGSGLQFQNLAQSIKGTGCNLTHVGLLFLKRGNPTQPITVSVRNNLLGVDLASFTIAPDELSTTEIREIYKPLSYPVKLNNGAVYYLVVSTAQSDVDNYYYLYDLWNAGDWYAEGNEFQWDGSTWKAHTNGDFCFETNRNAVPHDDNGHGTHTAGIAGAESNGIGVAGVAPRASIMSLKASDSSGVVMDMDWMAALFYAVENGADIISMSFGGPGYSALGASAVQYAYSKGVTVFASSGNSGDQVVYYPAGYDHVIGVGATDNKDNVAGFSNFNDSVDVSAPGVDVYSTTPNYVVGLTHKDLVPGYSFLSGTSMACPMAAGVGALMLSRNPALMPDVVERVLEANADDRGAPGRDDYYGYGRVNASRAINNMPLQPRIDSISPSMGKAGTELTVSGAHFGSGRGTSYVSFGDVVASDYLSWSDTAIQCLVPVGLSGVVDVTVTGDGGTSNAVGFTAVPSFYFAEGTTRAGFEEWLCLQNPNQAPTTAHITYMFTDGRTQTQDVSIGATSRATVEVNGVVGPDKDLSILVEAESPIVCERPMYFNYKGSWNGGHDVVGFTP